MAKQQDHHNRAFSLRIPDGRGRKIVITAWDDRWPRMDVEVRHGGIIVFPRGQLYCAGPRCGGWPSDGPKMRSLVCSLVAMSEGDTDADYFEDYTQVQIEWAAKWSNTISAVGIDRYGET